MMKFALDLADCRSTWRWEGPRIAAGRSWVEPFANPALESILINGPSSTLIVTRECMAGTNSAPAKRISMSYCDRSDLYTSMRRETMEWPLEFFLIELGSDDGIILATGRYGTAPVYVLRGRQVLHGSWSLPDLHEHLAISDLNDEGVIRFLCREQCYSSATLFRSVSRMTERSVGYFSRSGFHVRYPPPSRRDKPRELRPGVDAVSAFERLLRASLQQQLSSADGTCTEVSGGMDSAVVAAAMAELTESRISSCGIMIGGSAGDQQQRRRTELVEKLGATDVTVDVMTHAPFHRGSARRGVAPFSAMDEPYSEALTAELAAMRPAGTSVLLTGIGGDELMTRPLPEGAQRGGGRGDAGVLGRRGRLIFDELEPLDVVSAPVSAIPESCLLAQACRSPVVLRAGSWPVSPLCSPGLLRFCEWLPLKWRRGKRLLRAVLARRGLSAAFLYPGHRENFAHVMEHAMIDNGRPLVQVMGRGSVLADQGYLDLTRLDQRAASPAPRGVYEAVALELSLRTLSA